MKTVQECFREVNEESLIRYYLYKYPINLNEIANEDLTVKAAKELIWDKLRKYIERLRNIDIEKFRDGEECILFYHKKMEKGFPDDTSSLVYLNELIEKQEEADTYDYIFTKHAEILGFYVADTEMTQEHMIPLLTDVMHTASIFGFEQERLQEEIEKILEAAEKTENGNTVYYSLDDIREKLGLKKEEEDPMEDELRRNVARASFEYDRYCKKRELKALFDKISR